MDSYLDPSSCPPARPSRDAMHAATRQLHDAIDASMRRHGIPYLHPDDPTLQLDMLGSRHMADWQEKKVEWVFSGERCWSDLHQFYARYGVETSRDLIAELRELEGASGVLLTDCGMQAVAVTLDILARPGGHAVLMRGVYNKTRRYLEWLGERLRIDVTLVDETDPRALVDSIRPETFVVLGETYSNPLLHALDPAELGKQVIAARKEKKASHLRLVIDNTIATPWGVKQPLLRHEGIDVVVASGTKALAGEDRDLWGYIASDRVDFLNEAMDLLAMRGGTLDWRRAVAIVEGLPAARERFEKRCATACRVAAFLSAHPAVEVVYHPSLPKYRHRDVYERHYTAPSSLLSFKIRELDEDATRHFADVLATCGVFRYAGSFDGLSSKVNHHRTVSEYFTPEEDLEKAGITRLVRLGIGVEEPGDLIACLNWALWHHEDVSPEEVVKWQRERESELGIRSER